MDANYFAPTHLCPKPKKTSPAGDLTDEAVYEVALHWSVSQIRYITDPVPIFHCDSHLDTRILKKQPILYPEELFTENLLPTPPGTFVGIPKTGFLRKTVSTGPMLCVWETETPLFAFWATAPLRKNKRLSLLRQPLPGPRPLRSFARKSLLLRGLRPLPPQKPSHIADQQKQQECEHQILSEGCPPDP